MKKLFCFITATITGFVLVGCHSVETTTLTTTEQSTTTTTTTTTTTSIPQTISTVNTTRDQTTNIALDFDLESLSYQEPSKQFSLHSMISNNVIFQQEKEIHIFGEAEPGTLILVKLTKDSNQTNYLTNYVLVPDDGKWIVTLPSLIASYDTYTLTISDTIHETYITNCLIGEVWLISGQSNMELKVTEMDLGYELFKDVNEEYIRIFNQTRLDNNSNFSYTPTYDVRNGNWKIANSYNNISNCSGIGFSFAFRTLYTFIQQGKQVPIAIINTPIGGSQIHSWLPREEVQNSSILTTYVNSKGYETNTSGWNGHGWNNHNQVSANFNEKIAPLTNFNIRGVAWYQGESDPVYQENVLAIKALIDSWSKSFNKSNELLYFALIQIAPYDGADPLLGNSTNNYWYTGFADQRRAQFEVAMDSKYSEKVIIVPIYDIDLKWDVPSTQFLWADPVHPIVKLPVGQRLSKIVMSFVYLHDEDNLAPIIDTLTVGSDWITITFKNVGDGLKLFKESSSGVTTVEVIQNNGLRVSVSATIISTNQIVISNLNISEVKYVCYSNFSRNELSNLSNSNLIPAIPFVINIGDYS